MLRIPLRLLKHMVEQFFVKTLLKLSLEKLANKINQKKKKNVIKKMKVKH